MWSRKENRSSSRCSERLLSNSGLSGRRFAQSVGYRHEVPLAGHRVTINREKCSVDDCFEPIDPTSGQNHHGLSEIAALGLPEARQINRHQSTPSISTSGCPRASSSSSTRDTSFGKTRPIPLRDGGHKLVGRRLIRLRSPGDTIVDERLSALLNKRNTVDHVRTELPFAL